MNVAVIALMVQLSYEYAPVMRSWMDAARNVRRVTASCLYLGLALLGARPVNDTHSFLYILPEFLKRSLLGSHGCASTLALIVL